MTESNVPPSLARPGRILVAADSDGSRDLLARWMQEAGYDVTTCRSGIDLLAYLERSVLSEEIPEFDIVLSDLESPHDSPLDALDEFFGCDGLPPTILITAFGDYRTHAMGLHLGAAAVLEKPLEKGRLMARIRRLRADDAGAAAHFGVRAAPP